ncbi:glycosyltransferase [Spirosoma agri]|nr:glycosyltransferase [Spirosoma agri]
MDPSTGGPCQGIRNSAPALEEFSVYREVVCFDTPDAAYLGSDIFPIHALGVKKNAWYYSPKFVPWLQDNLHRFDAVITNGLWLYHSQATRKVIQRHRKSRTAGNELRWFVMPHGMLDPYFQLTRERKLKAVRNWIYWKLMEHKVVNQADGILFTTEIELILARKTFSHYHPQRETNVGYGIETPPAYSTDMRSVFLEKCSALGEQPYLLFLSRINYKKGVDLLIKAYNTILSESPDQTKIPKLVIAGPGLDTSYGQEMKRLIANTPTLSASIFFPGMLTGNAKWGALYGCDAFLLPSHQENFGIAVAEALACGKPVLISNQVNIWQTLENDGSGLVADDTLAGTEQLLRQWLAFTPTNKKAMGDKARGTFEHHFGIEQAALRFKEAISLRAI